MALQSKKTKQEQTTTKTLKPNHELVANMKRHLECQLPWSHWDTWDFVCLAVPRPCGHLWLPTGNLVNGGLCCCRWPQQHGSPQVEDALRLMSPVHLTVEVTLGIWKGLSIWSHDPVVRWNLLCFCHPLPRCGPPRPKTPGHSFFPGLKDTLTINMTS